MFNFKRISDDKRVFSFASRLVIMLEERGDRNWYSVNKQSDIQAVYDNAHRIYYADNRLSPFTVAVPYNFSISVWIFRILYHLIRFEFVDHVLIQLEYVNNFKTNYFPKNIQFPS
jgi:dipeptidase